MTPVTAYTRKYEAQGIDMVCPLSCDRAVGRVGYSRSSMDVEWLTSAQEQSFVNERGSRERFLWLCSQPYCRAGQDTQAARDCALPYHLAAI